MTFRSTEAHLLRLERSGRLIAFEPEFEVGDIHHRRLWLHPMVAHWVHHPGVGEKEERYFDAVRAFLKSFVIGADFDNDGWLRRLNTDFGAWYEFRIAFHPHHRIIGGFLRPGEFIALTHETRKNLDQKGFAIKISQAARVWKTLSFADPPLTAQRSILLEDFDNDDE